VDAGQRAGRLKAAVVKPKAFRTVADFRAWLEKNGATVNELLLRLYKVHARDKGLTYKEALDEALCFGWIDGVRRPLDADSFSQRFGPRKAKTLWSKVNTKRMRELLAEGRVRPAGKAAFERGTPSKYSFEARPSVLDPKFEKQLRQNAAAWAFWQREPPGRRRLCTFFVMEAKQEETRARRFEKLLSLFERGRTLPMLERPKKR
jgi:uncharacterized protein YdeI (YjbR/CyaY-like superfamily)